MHPLVMLPAMGCDHRLYAPVLNLLPNHSAQTIIADNASMAACVEQVLSDAPDRFIIFGTSFGGRVALETTIASPERIAGFVVTGAGTVAAADPSVGQRRVDRMRDGEFEAAVAELADMVSHLTGPFGQSTRAAFISMAHDLG